MDMKHEHWQYIRMYADINNNNIAVLEERISFKTILRAFRDASL